MTPETETTAPVIKAVTITVSLLMCLTFRPGLAAVSSPWESRLKARFSSDTHIGEGRDQF
jgi:hypothetical protein